MRNKLEIIRNECPYCKEILYVNKRTFANHVRWCKQNPRYEEIRKGTIEKIKENAAINSTRKDREITCPICGVKFIINITDNIFKKGKYRKTCSDECSKKLTALKTDAIEKSKKVSKSVREYLIKNGKQLIRGTHKKCKYCGKNFILNNHAEQEFCSTECARNYSRLKKIENIEEQQIYRSQAKFKFALNSYPDEFDFDLIKENGWYKASNHGNNLKGISRDHMFSVDEGYKQGVDPYLISHPANCKLMRHEDNFKKLTNCSITLDELIDRVNKWNEKYGVYKNKINYDKIERFKLNY